MLVLKLNHVSKRISRYKTLIQKVPLYLILLSDLCGVYCICIILTYHTGNKLYNEWTDIYILDMQYILPSKCFQPHERFQINQRRADHDDVIKWKHFPRYRPFVRGIHRSPVNSPHKGQWRGALMFSLTCVWINDWVNNREAGDLRRYRVHYDVTVMISLMFHDMIMNMLAAPCLSWLKKSLSRSLRMRIWSLSDMKLAESVIFLGCSNGFVPWSLLKYS